MKVAIIDNHALFRNGISALLARYDISVVQFEGGQEALDGLSETQADIVLLDIRMPNMNGIETLAQLRLQKTTKAPILMLTTSTDEQDLKQCLQGGAQGYLLKDMQPKELVKALNDALKGTIVVSQDMMPVLVKMLKNELNPEQDSFAKLSKREKEVACLIANGLNNKLIARSLNISDGTVKIHVKSILKKLSLHSRVEVAVMIVEGHYCPK